ncbi:MAG: YihY/virulence factor BrkB family protein [Bacteroidales bacterium]|nr:YihY/virulence factor BrkB family protein [Bacteroidales bacterium]MBR0029751.1 YihY/virulence factor BrkB family protein [Bacteroidales bacterium]MBR0084732.1 YihY/virulence factor BrkB family protein [Bacteroidales bacterium]
MSRLSNLFTDRIWSIDTEKVSLVSKGYARLVNFVKLIRITIDTFAENRMGFQCVALSYFMTLALIPLTAFIFAVTGGLGLNDFVDTILMAIAQDVDSDLLMMIKEKAVNIIDSAKSGGVGVISALMFLWTILWMMFQVERVFNNVWGIRKIPRKLYKRFGFYFLVLLLTPFIAIIFSAGIAYYSNFSKFLGLDLSELRFLPKLLGYLGFYIIATLTLSAMYKFIPATEVKYRNAIRAAAIGGAVFVIFQYLYLETQVFVARLNTVYGVLAAIPLFLIWLNFSWQIIIYGAELTYSFQNIKNYGLQEEVGKK